MEDLDFLKLYPPGNATIIVLLPNGAPRCKIEGIFPFVLGRKCPLLVCAFERGPHGAQQASIEASSTALVYSFLRYLYTGKYLTEAELDAPCSLLKHVELYKMAHDYDVPDLKAQAHLHLTRDIEMTCYNPKQPLDLCQAIRFVFEHMSSLQSIVETLVNYCVSNFKYHGLGDDEQFRAVAFDLPDFHKALSQTSCQRGFQDEGAIDIVRLPVCRSNPHSLTLSEGSLHTDKRTHAEFQFRDWYDSQTSSSDNDEKTALPLLPKSHFSKRRKTTDEDDFVEVPRPKNTASLERSLETDSSGDSDEDGFKLVHRPKVDPYALVASHDNVSPRAETAPAELPVPSVELMASIAAVLDREKKESDTGADSDWSFA